jgi:glycine oxidase
MAQSFDVVVIGAGAIGSMIGRELAKSKLRVAIVERSTPGSETSWVSLGGVIGGSAEEPPGSLLELLITTGTMYKSLAPELYDETSIDVEYFGRGTICVAFDEFDQQNQDEVYRQQTSLHVPNLVVHRLTGEEVRKLEPGISPEVRSALFYPNDSQVNNIRLVQACIKSALQHEASLFVGTTVQSLVISKNTVRGVRTSSEETLYSNWVVNAAGCWSDWISGGPPTGIIPSKGQTLSLRAHTVDAMFQHVVMSPGQFIVTRPDGEVRVGSTFEFVGFDKRNTAVAIQELLAGTFRIAPSLANSMFIEARVGFRPCSRDTLPIVGPSTQLKGLLFATGHNKFGITLAPVTAAIIRSIITGEQPPVDYNFISPRRFEI